MSISLSTFEQEYVDKGFEYLDMQQFVKNLEEVQAYVKVSYDINFCNANTS